MQDVDDPKAFEPNLHSGFSLPASNPFRGYRGSSQSQHPLCGGQRNTLQVVIPLHRLAHTHFYICGPYRLHSHLRTLRAALDSLEECLHLFKDTSLAVNTAWQGVHRETLTTPSFVSLEHVLLTVSHSLLCFVAVSSMLMLAKLKWRGYPQVSYEKILKLWQQRLLSELIFQS